MNPTMCQTHLSGNQLVLDPFKCVSSTQSNHPLCAIFADAGLKVTIARSRSAEGCFHKMTGLKNYMGNSLEATNPKARLQT